MIRRHNFRPLETRGRRTVAAILITFALVSALSIALSLRATGRSKHQAAVVQVAARQRTLAERYVNEVLLASTGRRSDPAAIAQVLVKSAHVLLNGGVAPAVNGDDDEMALRATGG
jgi:predicted nucleotide-binding protein (sugar kinase/HSP70/actin superfamily)